MASRLPSAAAALLALSASVLATAGVPNSLIDNETELPGCNLLSGAGLSGQLFFSNDTEYAATIDSYYSGDVQDVRPFCILKPETTQQVAAALKALSAEAGGCWTVAVRSGGHSFFPSNNAAHGVTIDLGRLNSVTYTQNSEAESNNGSGIASIGTGARWDQVYTVLEQHGAMVTGAREGHVGVGGFLLGGGLSWYSGKYGLAADNVVNYEVVLANGTIVTASSETRPDLFKALKGSLNNIGIVTRFDLRAFPANDVYGGIVAFSFSQKTAILEKFVNLVRNNPEFPAEAGFTSFSWSPGRNSSIAFITANVDGVANSTSFVGLEALGPLIDTRTTLPVSALVTQLRGALGFYNVWFTQTFHATMNMGQKALEVFEHLVADLEGQVDEEVTVIFLMTPLPTNYANRGPNILGLNQDLQEHSVILQVEALLPSPKYEALLTEKLEDATAKISAYSTSIRESVRFKYINYAHPSQDPFRSYGRENEEFLKRVAQEYDPYGFFQRRVSGGFKIPRRDSN
ncbi:hypothetical protein EsH8_IX_000372 [Colletotrichum jinshuiense]